MSEHKLMKWIIHWCARPGMHLAGPSDNGAPDINNLWLLIHGYLAGAEQRVDEGPGECVADLDRFREWLVQQQPRYFREAPPWLGNVILEEAGGDHWKAAEDFKRLAEQYLSAQGAEPG